MIYKEEVRDLFSVPEDYYLTHCISADFEMGKGIAVEFKKRFDMKNELNKKYSNNDWNGYGYCLAAGKIFNLITKEFYYKKPTYKTLEEALWQMRDYVIRRGITKIAMPTIASGLDRLDWKRVSEIIRDIFNDVGVEILVCKQK